MKHQYPLHSRLFRGFRSVWTRLPEPWRHQMWTWVGPRWQGAYARQMIAKPAKCRPTDAAAPLVIAGLFSTANGIGEGARATYRALKAAGLSPIAVDLSGPLAPVDLITDIPCEPMPDTSEGTLILQLNGPETMSAMQHLNMEFGRSWYIIGYWAWELQSFPKGWDIAFRYISEIWTISEFASSAIRQHPDSPNISVFGHAISPPQDLSATRKRFGWTQDEFVFLTMADSMSSLQRKNPFSAIRAFKKAFGDSRHHRLVVKTRNLDRYDSAREDLMTAIGDSSNIELLDESLSEQDVWTLLKSVDTFVSLHRSEGFGLVLAEAMALGKPVISTGWSGNMDFMSKDSAALISSVMVPCIDKYGVYQDTSAEWAQVDEVEAALEMVRIAGDPDYRESLSKAAKKRISDCASTAHVGMKMAKRLEAIASQADPTP